MGKKNKKLISLRRMAGFSQKDISSIIGVTQATYSRKENGTAAFDEKEMIAIHDVLHKSLNTYFPELKITDIFFEQ